MTSFNNATLIIDLEFGKIHNKIMNVVINDNIIQPVNDSATISIPVTLPTTIKIFLSGKDMNSDTVVDELGNIIQDLYVKINSIRIDCFEFAPSLFQKNINFLTEQNKIINTTYFGFNGCANIELNKKSVFQQIASWNE